jgi:tetratricopeptide (TPR) repeat protein
VNISFAEEHHLICPACEHSFKHAVWTIVDVTERPDLFERLQFGLLDDVLCTACGCPVNFDGALIVFNQAARPPVIYCRAGGADPEWQTREASRLISLLEGALGPSRGRSGPFQSTAQMDRGELFDILNVHVTSFDLKQLRRHQAPVVLIEGAASRGQVSEFFQEEPRALHEAFESDLLEVARLAHSRGHSEAGRRYDIYAGLARRCRAVGSRTAFRERGVGAGRWCAKLRSAIINLEGAVAAHDNNPIVRHADEALALIDRQRDTTLAVHVLGNLGFGLIRLPDVGVVDRAIECFNEILSRLDPDLSADDWARTQANLGRAYVKRVEGTRRENLGRAIEHLERALKVREAQGMVEKAHAIRHELDRIRSEPVGAPVELQNLEDRLGPDVSWPESAVQSFTSALAYQRRADVAHESEALERAIIGYRQTLALIEAVSDDGSVPRVRAMLAAALRDRTVGNRFANLDSAIEQCRLALAELNERPDTGLRVIVLDTMATIYADRLSIGSTDDMEQAIRIAEEALELRINDPSASEAAYLTHTNLGFMYMHRVSGDPVANAETAIHHLRKGLQGNNEWNIARAHLFLALIISRGHQHPAFTGVQDAITHAQAALNHYEKSLSAIDRALSHNALALAYVRCSTGDRASNLTLALEHFTNALEDLNPRDLPQQWSGIQHNLGVLHRDLSQGENPVHLETALDHFDMALAIRTHELFPLEWAQTHLEIARVHQALATVTPNASANHLAQADHHAHVSLQVFDDNAFPNEHRRCQTLIGNLRFSVDDWGKAHEAYSAAIVAGNRALASAYTAPGKTTRVAQTDALFSRDAYCLLKLGSLQNMPS